MARDQTPPQRPLIDRHYQLGENTLNASAECSLPAVVVQGGNWLGCYCNVEGDPTVASLDAWVNATDQAIDLSITTDFDADGEGGFIAFSSPIAVIAGDMISLVGNGDGAAIIAHFTAVVRA